MIMLGVTEVWIYMAEARRPEVARTTPRRVIFRWLVVDNKAATNGPAGKHIMGYSSSSIFVTKVKKKISVFTTT